jgi:heterogeneous nuclear ribonucleoprotein A1/A3
MVDDFMAHRPHTIDGRQTEPKRAMPRDEASKPEGQLTVKKIFIGGVKEDLTEDDLKYEKNFFILKFSSFSSDYIFKNLEMLLNVKL